MDLFRKGLVPYELLHQPWKLAVCFRRPFRRSRQAFELAGGAQLKVLLWALRHAGSPLRRKPSGSAEHAACGCQGRDAVLGGNRAAYGSRRRPYPGSRLILPPSLFRRSSSLRLSPLLPGRGYAWGTAYSCLEGILALSWPQKPDSLFVAKGFRRTMTSHF